jgi:uronate dehydrogenase
MSKKKILFTGPNGRIGSQVMPMMRERYEVATFDLQPDADDPLAFQGDLQSIDALQEAMAGCEVVVHMAATSDEAPFEQLLPNNLVGAFNVLEAARLAGVKRVVFASTVQAIGYGLKRDGSDPFRADQLPRPGSVYGATKVWGEALGSLYHDKHKLEFIALRIGGFQPYDSDWLQKGIGKNIWLSPRDMFQLLWRAIETPGIGYAIVHGTSRVPLEEMSLQEARDLLGYEPEDDAEEYFAK